MTADYCCTKKKRDIYAFETEWKLSTYVSDLPLMSIDHSLSFSMACPSINMAFRACRNLRIPAFNAIGRKKYWEKRGSNARREWLLPGETLDGSSWWWPEGARPPPRMVWLPSWTRLPRLPRSWCHRLPVLPQTEWYGISIGFPSYSKQKQSCDLTSESWDLAMSTRVIAAGWTISRLFMIVAPSLEMMTFPSLWISLSIPLGPSVVRTISAIAAHAFMLLMSWAFPWDVSVPSLSKIIEGCIIPAPPPIILATS